MIGSTLTGESLTLRLAPTHGAIQMGTREHNCISCKLKSPTGNDEASKGMAEVKQV